MSAYWRTNIVSPRGLRYQFATSITEMSGDLLVVIGESVQMKLAYYIQEMGTTYTDSDSEVDWQYKNLYWPSCDYSQTPFARVSDNLLEKIGSKPSWEVWKERSIPGQCRHPLALIRCSSSLDPLQECGGPGTWIVCSHFLHQTWLQPGKGHTIMSVDWNSILSTNMVSLHLVICNLSSNRMQPLRTFGNATRWNEPQAVVPRRFRRLSQLFLVTIEQLLQHLRGYLWVNSCETQT